MEKIFLKLLNMSITAGWLILVVILLRMVLKRAPRWLSCILWGIVAVRLVCPTSLESSFSLIPSAETIHLPASSEIEEPLVSSGIPALNSTVNPVLKEAIDSASSVSGMTSLRTGMYFAEILWAAGLIILLLYGFASFARLHIRLREAAPLRENIWLCDAISSPFVRGIAHPRIYLPSSLGKEELPYVLAHEQAHIRRRDHWWKLLAYLLLSVYWFHPLVWAAYVLFGRDIELACDERVIGKMDAEGKKAYSNALVTCSMEKRLIPACPLAFGEIGVKTRVKAVLNYRRPAFWVILAAVLTCLLAAVCFLTNPRQDTYKVEIRIPAGSEGGIYYSDEEISPYGKTITLWAEEGLGDTEVVLLPSEMENEQEQLVAPEYMTPGMPVKMEAEKDVWYRIGINVSNPGKEDK